MQNGRTCVPRASVRSETEITETETPSRTRIVLWVVVGLALVVGVVLYFKYAHLLAPLLG